MTIARERRVETRFARRAAAGRGVGIDEAAAAAEARIAQMRDSACARIGEMVQAMQGARSALATGDPEALRFVHAQADALVGLSDLFGLPEIGKAALSLCQLFDACSPARPTSDGVRVHLDALQLFWAAESNVRVLAAPRVLEGLRQVTLAARPAKD